MGAPEHRLNAEQEFLDRKRFGQIVVTADFESLDFVFFKRFGGQKNDRRGRIGRANGTGKRKAVEFRHHDVDKTEIEFRLPERHEAVFAVGFQHNLITTHGQVFPDYGSEVGIIFEEQNAGGGFHGDQLARGSVRVAVVPWPGSDAIAIEPPMASVISFTYDSPMPNPLTLCTLPVRTR